MQICGAMVAVFVMPATTPVPETERLKVSAPSETPSAMVWTFVTTGAFDPAGNVTDWFTAV